MIAYVALLRGVNVGGITIRSADLGELFRSLGFGGVRTVLASGNVVFESEEADAAALKARIEKALRERFGYDAWIVLVTREKLAEVVAAFPFDAEREGWHPYVLFASDAARLRELVETAPTLDPDEEIVAGGDGVLYWQLNISVGSTNTKLAKLTAKPRFKPTTTNRNLRTLTKLL
ncbi:DUF1697 domain-containing protein [Gryllotalpicola protaetiae]|uniref:DUF1697 domain-containing protein n=1 Tax=Gryllotalpicola protaetiae TaxID=2419771 RepID=A0A387BVU4_9MICO|nr:DUF1697 domain-containing protein [Gryllotalpicola protaetiae]AYG04967.1 DUF1697 domain-containing protein [Gryllotalpicola protaetiae]